MLGHSLDETIATYTDFNGLADFETNFAYTDDALTFIQGLTQYTTTPTGSYPSSYGGGLVSGNLSNTDPVADTPLTLSLFELNADNTSVRNDYSGTGVTVISGGAAETAGVAPSSSVSPSSAPADVVVLNPVTPSAPTTPVTPVTPAAPTGNPAALGDVFKVVGGTQGTDWDWDDSTGILTILSGEAVRVSDADSKTGHGRIVIADGVNANLYLSGVSIDMTAAGANLANTAGITLGTGDAVITLEGSNTIKGSGTAAGIQIKQGAASDLIINGSGTLNVYGGDSSGSGGSGIGCAYGQSAANSNIAIESGIINAYGGMGSAGIGAGYNASIHDITITGGTIYATSMGHGAGIGGGWYGGRVNDITITGGDITAESTTHGSGIGAGCLCSGTAVRNITITGGKINATGGDYGAGIGGSNGGGNQGNVSGTIKITGGDVTATGGHFGSGIGSGSGSSVAAIIIENGTVTATGGNRGAGIGAGQNGAKVTGNITIDGGRVTATGGNYGAGIGVGASSGSNQSQVSGIYINNGTVTATGGASGAGIGAGSGGSIVNLISINGGNVTAAGGDNGAGVGVGADGSTAGTVAVTGGTVIAQGGANGSTGSTVRISGGEVDATGGANGAGVGAGAFGSKIENIIVSDGTLTAEGGQYGAGIGSGASSLNADGSVNMSAVDNISIQGGRVTAAGGEAGAGVGSGYGGSEVGVINISGGLLSAVGKDNAIGIGSGRGSHIAGGSGAGVGGTKDYIVISGGTVSAVGGWTNDANNIGGFSSDDTSTPVTVKITGENISVKAGERGEGGYSTTGVVDAQGNDLFAFALTAKNLGIHADIDFPVNVTVTADDGTVYEWTGVIHENPDGTVDDGVYLWMNGTRGNNAHITVTDGEGNTLVENMKLYFFADPEDAAVPNARIWRNSIESLDPIDFKPGTYGDVADTNTYTIQITKDVTTVTDDTVLTDSSVNQMGIRLQIGANRWETLVVPQFYFSTDALGLSAFDISTEQNAALSVGLLGDMVDRVSTMRGEYGAIQNRLEHNVESLAVSVENLTAAEARIRDTDMAEEMMGYVRQRILLQTAQAMLAQANQEPQQVMQLIQ